MQLRIEKERLGLELVALQEEVDVQANGELRQCRANDQSPRILRHPARPRRAEGFSRSRDGGSRPLDR